MKKALLFLLTAATLVYAGTINPGDPTQVVVPTSDTTVSGTKAAANQFPVGNTGVLVLWSMNLLGQPYGSKACFLLQVQNSGGSSVESVTYSISGFVYGFSVFEAPVEGFAFSAPYPQTTVLATYGVNGMKLSFDPPIVQGAISPIIKMCTSLPDFFDMSGSMSGVLRNRDAPNTSFALSSVLPHKKQ